MPYNQASQPETKNRRANGVHASSAPNGLRNEALEHPANAEVAQGSERSVYTREVAGSNPAFRTIPLTRGYVAVVDADDYDSVAAYKWTAMPCGTTVYAKRVVRAEDGRRRTVLLHRFILGEPSGLVDHRDRDGLNCRRYNLRTASFAQNSFNKRLPRSSKYGFLGVASQTRDRYRGCVDVGRRHYYTKTFHSPVLAAAARDVLARQLHGEYAVLNFRFIPASAIRPGA